MSKRLEKLLASKPECEEDKNKPAPAPADPEPGTGNPEPGTGNQEPGTGNQEPAPGNQEPGTGNQEPGTGNQEPADGGAPADGDDPDDPDDDEDKPATRGALAMLERRLDALVADNSRLRAENAKLGEDVGRLRAMLRDPSYAAAAASATHVPAASDAAPAILSRAQADAAYAKITDPRERAKFREAHRAELGLR